MAVLVWVDEATWPACIDAAEQWAPASAETVLIATADPQDATQAHAAFAGLLGRGGSAHDPGPRIAAMGQAATAAMLEAAARRLGRPCTVRTLSGGHPERALVEAAVGADLLVMARDGDADRLGPRSLGPVSRFVVDHAPCPVLLVWPRSPATAVLPPPPPPPAHAAPR